MGKLLKALEARVLVDIKELGVTANHILVSTPEHIAVLAKAGLVDAEEAAVAYVKGIGSPRVVLTATDDQDDAVQTAVANRVASSETLKAADQESAKAEVATDDVQTSAQAGQVEAVK